MLAARKLEIGSGIPSFRATGQARQKGEAMSVPTHPPNPQGRHVPPRTTDPPDSAQDRRPSGPDAGAAPPPIMDDDEREGQDVPQGKSLEEALGDALGPRSSSRPRLTGRGRRLAVPPETSAPGLTAEQRLLVLDAWRCSGLPAGDFAPLVGLSRHTLYEWKRRFEAEGPAGLQDKPRGSPRGSRLPEVTKRAILMMKQDNPDWGCERISALLMRGPALPAGPQAVARVLHEAGYEMEEAATRPHAPPIHHFERSRPNQMWQTDLFTFVLKRQNRRVYLVAFMDDHSRFLVGYGLHDCPYRKRRYGRLAHTPATSLLAHFQRPKLAAPSKCFLDTIVMRSIGLAPNGPFVWIQATDEVFASHG